MRTVLDVVPLKRDFRKSYERLFPKAVDRLKRDWETIVQLIAQFWWRGGIRSSEQERRFSLYSHQYPTICARLLGGTSGSRSDAEGYDWTSFSRTLRAALGPHVPFDFLGLRVVRQTMVFGYRCGIRLTASRIAVVEDVFGPAIARRLLLEDWVGRPSITDGVYRTSTNRAHHAVHLAAHHHAIGTLLWEAEHVVEWGGGYGNMARILRRMNPALTYTIIDLPESLALQYVYLTAVEGRQPNVIAADDPLELCEGKVNLVSSARVTASPQAVRCDAFLSTWALTESPKEAQQLVLSQRFFGARRILMAVKLDASNILAGQLPSDIIREPIGPDMAIGPAREYWLR